MIDDADGELAKVRELFEAALEHPSAGRRIFLDALRIRDPRMAREVEELLRCHDGSGDFLNAPAITVLDSLEEGERVSALVGRRLGHYRIVRRIATGGMGTVFEADDESTDRRVALKILRTTTASGTWFRRFEREGEILSRLRHAAITAVHETGTFTNENERLPYIAMELVDGVGLLEWIHDERPTLEAKLDLFLKIAEAIEHAHHEGVIHRDIKPPNILVDASGRPKVLDFGISRSMDDGLTAMTTTGVILGTFAYMSPEQVLGRSSDVDATSDVYSLGAVLFEMLTAEKPIRFDSESLPAVASAIVERSPRRLSGLDPSLAGDLETIVSKALAKERSRRYATVTALRADVRRFREGRPIIARPPGSLYLFARFVGRHRFASAFAGVALALLIAWAITATIAARRERGLAERETTARAVAEAAMLEATTEAARARRRDYRGRVAAAHAAIELGQVGAARSHLDEAPVELRSWEWRYLHAITAQRLEVLDTTLGETMGLAASHDRDRLAYATRDGKVRVRSATAGAESEFRHRGGGGVYTLDFHPDGQHLLLSARGASVHRVDGGAEVAHFDPGVDSTAARFHPGGELSVIAGFDGRLRRWRWRDGEVERVTRPSRSRLSWVEFHPDGQSFVTCALDRRLRLHSDHDDAITNEVTAFERPHVRDWRARFSPDGRWVATFADRGTIAVRSVPELELVSTLGGHGARLSDIAFSPDGGWLASTAHDDSLRIWSLGSFRELARLDCGVRAFGDIAFWGTESLIATRGWNGDLALWDPLLTSDALVLDGDDVDVNGVAVTSDGSLVAAGGFGRVVRLWNGADGESLRLLHGAGGFVRRLDFGPDDRRLVGATEDAAAYVWDVATGEVIHRLPLDGAARSVKHHRELDAIAVGTDRGSVFMFDATTGREQWRHCARRTEAVSGLDLHPVRPIVAFASDVGPVSVVDTESDALLFVADRGAGRVGGEGLAFGPHGDVLATLGAGEVRLWSIPDGSAVGTLSRPTGRLFSASFSPEGDRLATGGEDGAVTIWDLSELCAVLSLSPRGGWTYSVRFARDTDRLVCGLTTGEVLIFDTRPASDRTRARRRLLTLQEEVRERVASTLLRYPVPEVAARVLESVDDLARDARDPAVRMALSARRRPAGEILAAAHALLANPAAPEADVVDALHMIDACGLDEWDPRRLDARLVGLHRYGRWDRVVLLADAAESRSLPRAPLGRVHEAMARARLGDVAASRAILDAVVTEWQDAETRMDAALRDALEEAATLLERSP